MYIPKPKKLKSGNYNLYLRLDGKNTSVTAPSAKECVKKALLIKAGYKTDKRLNARTGEDMTLGQAIDTYISTRDNILSPLSVRTYIGYRKTRFQDVMDSQLKHINWHVECNKEAAMVSAKTLKCAWGFVCSVLRYVKMEVPDVKLPQVIIKDSPWLEPEQIFEFQKAIEDDIYEIQMLLALHGLRRSEICALDSWNKFDLDKGLIFIHGSLVLDKNNKFVYKKANKNCASRRTLPIMIPRLKSLLNSRTEETNPLITVYPNTIYKHVNRACVKAKLPEVGVHGLRRSFASLCYHLQIPEAHAMRLGGWSDIFTMRKIYMKLAERDIVNNQDKLLEFFSNTDKNTDNGVATTTANAIK